MTSLLLLGGAVIVAPDSRPSARLRALLVDGGAATAFDAARARRRWWRALRDPAWLRLAPLAVVPAVPLIGVLQSTAVALVLLVVSEMTGTATRRRRSKRHLADWERALESVTAELRIGQQPSAALAAAARGLGRRGQEDPVPAGQYEAGVANALVEAQGVAGLGGDGPTALERGDDPVATELAAAWRLADRHGVPLADVVDRLRSDVAERRDRNARVEASLAGPRATSLVLSALPVVGMVMGTGIGAEPLRFLTGSAAGGVVSLVGASLLVAGLWWTNRILDGASR